MKTLTPFLFSLFVSVGLSFGAFAQGESGTPTADAEKEEQPAAADTSAPAEPAAETPAAPEAPSAADLKTADQAYQLKVRQIENNINELKERIFRSKAKLTLLTEQVTGGAGTGASAVITHNWQMGNAFRLAEVHYYLDGAPIWQQIDEKSDKLTKIKKKRIFDGNLVEGSHTLSVKMILKGNGSGVFSYIDGFKWNIQQKYTFTAEPGRVHEITAVAFEKGNFTTDIRDRPALRFDTATQVDAPEENKKKADK